VQPYLAPGCGVAPANDRNRRVEIQVAVTRSTMFDDNLIVIFTRGF